MREDLARRDLTINSSVKIITVGLNVETIKQRLLTERKKAYKEAYRCSKKLEELR